jgi:putative endonuclease
MSTLRQHLDRRSKAAGRRGEALAAAHLERLGYRILARNHRTRFGELDLVATTEDERTLVFVEVKTRRGQGSPWDALGAQKQGRVRRMAASYLAEVTDRPLADELRFDAIGVVFDPRGRMVRLDHVEAAF